jgi:hypothetical protein
MNLGEGQAKTLDRVHEPLYDFGFGHSQRRRESIERAPFEVTT